MESSYVSVIKIANQPIIPPLMTDEKREEMNYYKHLAIDKERKRKLRRQSIDSGVMITSLEKEEDIKSFNVTEEDEKSPTQDQRPLERRNSYTLESPSPILLAFMNSLIEKNSPIDLSMPSTLKQDINEQITIKDLETSVKCTKRKLYDGNDTSEEYTTAETDSSLNDDHVSKYIQSLEIEKTPENHDTDKVYVSNDDSFANDFHLLESDFNVLCLDSNHENSFSDCSSVSLNIPSLDEEVLSSELDTFLQMKEKLASKYWKQFMSLKTEYQREKDALKNKFRKAISRSSSRTTPSSCTVKESEMKSVEEKTVSKVPICKSSTRVEHNMNAYEAATVINATARGYLTRRLFKTSRVQLLVQTIKDCLVTAVSLQNEVNLGLSELDLQNRLLQQLTVACNDLHNIFSLPVKERMAVISEDREKKNRLLQRTTTPLPLSEATRRTLQRKLGNSVPPMERKTHRKRCRSVSSVNSDCVRINDVSNHGRKIALAVRSHTYSASHSNRKPWR